MIWGLLALAGCDEATSTPPPVDAAGWWTWRWHPPRTPPSTPSSPPGTRGSPDAALARRPAPRRRAPRL
ncbi:MAG: hypothetical protein R3F43_09230 [bacterium]